MSTDSQEYQEVGHKYGIKSPFLRPPHLSGDNSSCFDVLKHAMAQTNDGNQRYDGILMMEPSSPFSTSKLINEGIELYKKLDASLVVSIREAGNPLPFFGCLGKNDNTSDIVSKVKDYKIPNRQTMPEGYTLDGNLYIINWERFISNDTIYHDPIRSYGIITERPYSVEIDNEIEFEYAKFLVEKKYINLSHWL